MRNIVSARLRWTPWIGLTWTRTPRTSHDKNSIRFISIDGSRYEYGSDWNIQSVSIAFLRLSNGDVHRAEFSRFGEGTWGTPVGTPVTVRSWTFFARGFVRVRSAPHVVGTARARFGSHCIELPFASGRSSPFFRTVVSSGIEKVTRWTSIRWETLTVMDDHRYVPPPWDRPRSRDAPTTGRFSDYLKSLRAYILALTRRRSHDIHLSVNHTGCST